MALRFLGDASKNELRVASGFDQILSRDRLPVVPDPANPNGDPFVEIRRALEPDVGERFGVSLVLPGWNGGRLQHDQSKRFLKRIFPAQFLLTLSETKFSLGNHGLFWWTFLKRI